jgi:hypothetical protein
MPKIRVIVEDEDGNAVEKTFALSGDLNSLDSIDEAVEQFKNQALPQVEQHLLTKAQERTVAAEKKTQDSEQRD